MSKIIVPTVLVLLAIATLVCATIGVWANDDRWGGTAGIIGLPTLFAGIGYGAYRSFQ